MSDGDGCISLSSPSRHPHLLSATLVFSQSQNDGIPDILLWIQARIGGQLTALKPKDEDQKIPHQLFVHHLPTVLQIIGHLRNYVTLKMPQLEYMYRLLMRPWKFTVKDAKRHVVNMDHMKTLACYQTVKIDPSRLTTPYLAGLVESEGCIGIYPDDVYFKVIVSITQISSPKLLEAIQRLHPRTCVTSGRIVWKCQKALNVFLREIYQFLVGKRFQADDALRAIEIKADRTETTASRKRKLSELCEIIAAKKYL